MSTDTARRYLRWLHRECNAYCSGNRHAAVGWSLPEASHEDAAREFGAAVCYAGARLVAVAPAPEAIRRSGVRRAITRNGEEPFDPRCTAPWLIVFEVSS